MQDSFTFAHYAEESERVDYRYLKSFFAHYTDEFGQTERRMYSMYVRDVKRGVVTYLHPLAQLLDEMGIAPRYSINQISCTNIDLAASYAVMVDDIRNNQARNLYRIQK
jgi:aminoglycoside 3-N-acetyltransferase